VEAPYLRLRPAERFLVGLYRRTGGAGVIVLISGLSIAASVLATWMLVVPLLTPEDASTGMLTVALGIAVAVPLVVAPAATQVLVGLMVRLDDAYRTVLALSTTDPLTAVANRRGFFAAAESQLRAHDESQAVLVGMVDVSDFKGINDTHGHPFGDEVLVELARRLQGLAAPDGIVGRIGGDEFALLRRVPAPGADRFMRAVQDQCAAFSVADTARRVSVPVATAIGLVVVEPGETVGRALFRADAALFGR
jgi:diguanylate cyclase (GGDEF)-like protein